MSSFFRNKNIGFLCCLFATLLFSLNIFAGEQPAETSMTSAENQGSRMISLADFAALAEHWLEKPVLVGNLATNYIRVNFQSGVLNYGQILTQLNLNGFTAFKTNDSIKIIPNREARELSIPVVDKDVSYFEDEYVTDIIKIEKACAVKMIAAIRPLVPQYGMLTTYEGANTLVIIDTYGNIQRIKSIVKSIDSNLSKPEDCRAKK